MSIDHVARGRRIMILALGVVLGGAVLISGGQRKPAAPVKTEVEQKADLAAFACKSAAVDAAKWSATSDWIPNSVYRQLGRDLLLTGHDVKFKNGFGGERYIAYQCSYNMDTNRATFLRVID